MRTVALSSLLLVSGILGLAQDSKELAQDSKELVDKAPAPVEEALRARVDQYYHAFMAGKYKDAYLLVADDSQDAFLESDKQQYKACETLRIRYSDNFTKAVVVESCNSEWKWHGIVTPTTFPITSFWEVMDGKWYWHYVKPTQVASPFSPTGFVPLPPPEPAPAAAANGPAPVIPSDMKAAAKGILAQVAMDKQAVHLSPDQSSQDVVRIRNGMPGVVTLKLGDVVIPGLRITVGKLQLQANEETTVLFEWRPNDPGPQCQDCATKIGNSTIALQVVQTGRLLPINIFFDRGPQAAAPTPRPASQAPQK